MRANTSWARRAVILGALGLLLPAKLHGADCTPTTEPKETSSLVKSSRSGGWYVAESANFQACSLQSDVAAVSLARAAERLQKNLQLKWLGTEANAWGAKCQIVVHPTLQSYVAACGRGSEHTVGSSLVKTGDGQIQGRRIDLLGTRTDYLTAALPHELTHVVLKDRFPSTSVPRWADEGAAILADDKSKQGRHKHDLEQALAQHKTYDAAALLTMEQYPPPTYVGIFYGQSASLAEFLVERKDAAHFTAFIRRATLVGYDAALRECYDIRDVGDLDRQWRRFIAARHETRTTEINVVSSLAAK